MTDVWAELVNLQSRVDRLRTRLLREQNLKWQRRRDGQVVIVPMRRPQRQREGSTR